MTAAPVTFRPAAPKNRTEGFLPPEGVPISFAIASLGARLGAQCMDVLITWLAVLLFALLLIWLDILPFTSLGALLLILIFLIRTPYYIAAELVWKGRTLGKRIARIRVISANGRRLTPHQVTARNLMKEVEFFTPATLLLGAGDLGLVSGLITFVWVVTVLIVPCANRRRQRLGDMIAGTLVVENPKPALLADLALAAPAGPARFDFLPAHLEFYGRYELHALEAILRDPPKGAAAQVEIARVADAILRKTGYPGAVAAAEKPEFLTAFYRAQRAHLESRQLFGDRRDDKFHKTQAPSRKP